MPTSEQLLELVADGAKEFEPYAFRMCSDGMQNIYMVPSGQLYKDGTRPAAEYHLSMDGDESATKPGQYCYLAWSTASLNEQSVGFRRRGRTCYGDDGALCAQQITRLTGADTK